MLWDIGLRGGATRLDIGYIDALQEERGDANRSAEGSSLC